jgi:hypothetical protein
VLVPPLRLKGALFMHNTIALMPKWDDLKDAKPEDVAFHWNVSEGGCPVSIFVQKLQDNECLTSQDYLVSPAFRHHALAPPLLTHSLTHS